MAALEVLCEFSENIDKKVVLLFEEPETYLHPHLKRKLRNVFERLSKLNWTIICSTHSSEFIDFSGHQNLIRLCRTSSELNHGVILTDTIGEGPKFQEKLDERGNHELLFANKIILCEGKDDLYAIKLFLSKKKIDTDARSITIIDIGGIKNMCDYASMASKLNIAWYSITDEDTLEDGSINVNTKKTRVELSSIKRENDLIELWLGSLEKSLKIKKDKKATPEWQRANLETKSLEQIKKSYPEFIKSLQPLVEWIDKETNN